MPSLVFTKGELKMKNISFETGIKEYAINGDENRVIKLNINDPALVERLQSAGNIIDEVTELFSDKNHPTFEELIQADKLIRERLEQIFGQDICSIALGKMNCFAFVSPHKYLIQSFLDAFLEEITKEINSLVNARQITVEKKTDKYISQIKAEDPSRKKTVPFIPLADPDSMTNEQKEELLRKLLNLS